MKYRIWLIAAICSFTASFTFAQKITYISNDTVSYVKLMLVGDIPMDKRLLESVYNADLNTYDFNGVFYYIKPILNLGDIVVGNLETTIGSGNYGNYPLYKAPEEFATALKYAGFNLLMTANSKLTHHTIADWTAQRKALDKVGLKHTGSYITPEDKAKRNPTIIEKKGIKVAFLNYMQGVSYSEEKMPFVNAAQEDLIKKDIELAKSSGADFIVVYFNWGTEYQGYANVVQQKLGNFAVNNGAHLVVGSRPHVVQQLENKEIILNKKVHEYIIAYSLGDFYTTAMSQDVNGSIILEVIVSKNKKTSEVGIAEFGFISTYTQVFEKNERNTWTILPVSEVKKGNITTPITQAQREKMIASNDKVKYKLANVIDEVQYEMDDKIIADVDEVLYVSRRPLNEDKNFRLDNKDKLPAFSGFASVEKPKETEKPKVAEKTPEVKSAPVAEVKPQQPVTETKPEPQEVKVVNDEVDKTSGEIYYRVQFLALKTKIDINTQYYKHLDGYEVVYEEGYYKYLIGLTNNLKAINDMCLDIKRMGHKTAFVVAYKNGERIKF